MCLCLGFMTHFILYVPYLLFVIAVFSATFAVALNSLFLFELCSGNIYSLWIQFLNIAILFSPKWQTGSIIYCNLC
jgi:hypothetical protein